MFPSSWKAVVSAPVRSRLQQKCSSVLAPSPSSLIIVSQWRRQGNLQHVSTQKEISEKEVEEIMEYNNAREQFIAMGLPEDEAEIQSRAAANFGGNIYYAAEAMKAERGKALSEAEHLRPTTVPFSEGMREKMERLRAEGGVVAERARKRREQLLRAEKGLTTSPEGNEESVDISVVSGATVLAADASAPSALQAAESVVPNDIAGNPTAASDVSLELTLKRIYEVRRNDPQLVGDAIAKLTRTLYHARYAGNVLAKEASLKAIADKDISELSSRQKERYSKAVQEIMWLEEWALQEVIMGVTEAEETFEGAPDEYKQQLMYIRDHFHESVVEKVSDAVDQRLAGKPLAFILGTHPFLETEIICDPPVMCPRTETEHWVGWLAHTLSTTSTAYAAPKPTPTEKIKKAAESLTNSIRETFSVSGFDFGAKYDPKRGKKSQKELNATAVEDPTLISTNTIDILDMCAGSGAIGVALAKSIVGARVVAMDILPEAVQLCRRNAMHNRIPKWKYRAEESDLFALVVHNALFQSEVAKAQRGHVSAADGGSDNSDNASEYIPPLDQLPMLLSEAELHATMHYLSKASSSDSNSSSSSSMMSNNNHVKQSSLAPRAMPLPVTYDMIVCNPPYIHPDDFKHICAQNNGVEWETELAIVGDPLRVNRQQLYYRDLCILGHKFSKPVGKRPKWIPLECPSICVEVGLQGAVVADLFTQSKLWGNVVLHVDGDRMPRWVTAVRKDFDW